MNQYLIAYNNTQSFDLAEIHQAITSIPTITDWWHYLPNLYIVSTNSNAKYLADQIIPKFQGLLFLVVRLDMKDYNGVLNRDAWEWIRMKNNQNLKFKVTSKPTTNQLPPIPSLPPLLSSILSSSQPRVKSISLEEVLGIKK